MASSAQDARVVWLSGVALAGWMLISMTDGAIDLGRLPAGGGATALAWGLIGASLLAVAAVAVAGSGPWGGPVTMGIGAIGALTGWSALSMIWAPAPELAWVATNRTALGLAALVVGALLARGVRDPARGVAIGVAVASVPVLGWALATRVLPELLSPAGETPRLAAPIGHANTLALVAALAVPGALCLASARRWRPAGTAILSAVLLVVAMSGSRSGILALAAAVALALWLQADRPAMLATVGAAVAGAVPAAVYALAAGPLTTEPVLADPSARRGAGLLLGALVFAGIAIAATIGDALDPPARRIARWIERPAAGRWILAGTGSVIVAGIVLSAVIGRGAQAGAGRSLSLDSNNRTAWWEQAWRGFLDAPIAGGGAGGFPLTHILHRDVAAETLQVRQPHQLGLELLAELGVVGLLLGLAAVVAVAWGARRAGRAAGPALGIVAAFLVQAQLDIPWTSPAATVPAMGAAGVVMAMAARRGSAGRGLPAARIGVVAVVAIAACVSAIWLWHGERSATDAFLAKDADPARAAALGRSAAGEAPLAIGPLLVEAYALTRAGDGGDAVAAARRAADRQPDNPFAWECLAAVAPEPQRADALTRWTELDPRRNPAVPPTCQPGW